MLRNEKILVLTWAESKINPDRIHLIRCLKSRPQEYQSSNTWWVSTHQSSLHAIFPVSGTRQAKPVQVSNHLQPIPKM